MKAHSKVMLGLEVNEREALVLIEVGYDYSWLMLGYNCVDVAVGSGVCTKILPLLLRIALVVIAATKNLEHHRPFLSSSWVKPPQSVLQ